MRIADTTQAFEDHLNSGKDVVKIGGKICRTYAEMIQTISPETYERKYGEFLETLHKCLKCGSLFDDEANMSDDIDICRDCRGKGQLAHFQAATEIKKHLQQGEQ